MGSFLPGPPIGNLAMEDYLGRIGGVPSRHRPFILRQNKIKQRHYALDTDGVAQHSSADMAVAAIHDALVKSELSSGDIQFLATATTLGDSLIPGMASHVHAGLGIAPLEIASLQSVCASSLMALKYAWLQLAAGEHTCAAVCGSEFASRYFRPHHYESTRAFLEQGAISFEADFLRFTLSDGAGAALLEATPNQHGISLRIRWIELRSFADRFDTCMKAGILEQGGFWSDVAPAEAVANGAFILQQDFALMKRMLPVWVGHYLSLIDRGKIDIPGIDHLVSHYSSHSLREEVITLLKQAGAMIDEEKWFSNLATKGNTGSASIFILLEELMYSGRLKAGEQILCHVPESGRALNGFMLLEVVDA